MDPHGSMTHVCGDLIAEAIRIERECNGKALTTGEADTLRAVHFLRQIAPYLFEQPASAGKAPCRDEPSN